MHKCLALLWQCFSMVGPAQLHKFCRSIRGIVTDMGVERLIVRMPVSVLSNFFRHLAATSSSSWIRLGSSRTRSAFLDGSMRSI